MARTRAEKERAFRAHYQRYFGRAYEFDLAEMDDPSLDQNLRKFQTGRWRTVPTW